MNILVIGGGAKGRFGNDFVNRARDDGHRVLVVSHKDHGYDNEDHVVADFNSTEDVMQTVENLLSKIDKLDIFLYNTVAGAGPWIPEHFQSTSKFFPESDWLFNLRVNVIIPNNLSIIALKKMSKGSKLVFMTTGRSYYIEDTSDPHIPSYYGGKAFQNHIMIGFGMYNDKGAIASSITGHFDYPNPEVYRILFEKAYQHVMNLDESHNGKVIPIVL